MLVLLAPNPFILRVCRLTTGLRVHIPPVPQQRVYHSPIALLHSHMDWVGQRSLADKIWICTRRKASMRQLRSPQLNRDVQRSITLSVVLVYGLDQRFVLRDVARSIAQLSKAGAGLFRLLAGGYKAIIVSFPYGLMDLHFSNLANQAVIVHWRVDKVAIVQLNLISSEAPWWPVPLTIPVLHNGARRPRANVAFHLCPKREPQSNVCNVALMVGHLFQRSRM
mmetsp:Transcript_3653/g.13119  ORF Transcript_3653/g.13119 Transcript_3653/m.13119 type:complete len:223 (+) Transcript_3653:742-1410(+)